MTDGPVGAAPDQSLRDYAVALYARDGVSAACLLLQDCAQVDVNVLLFAAWATARGLPLFSHDIRDAGAHVREWHEEIVCRLREVRRRLKGGPAPAPSEQTVQLRKQLQAIEIAAELIELDELEVYARRLKKPSTDPRSASNGLVDALTLVVAESAGRGLDPREKAAVLQIAESCEACAAGAAGTERKP